MQLSCYISRNNKQSSIREVSSPIKTVKIQTDESVSRINVFGIDTLMTPMIDTTYTYTAQENSEESLIKISSVMYPLFRDQQTQLVDLINSLKKMSVYDSKYNSLACKFVQLIKSLVVFRVGLESIACRHQSSKVSREDSFGTLERELEESANELKKFIITSSAKVHHLFEKAMLCADSAVIEAYQNIEKFKKSNPDELLKVVKLCALHDAKGTLQNIKYFGFTNQNQLFELAMFFAERNFYATLKKIQYFNLRSQNKLFKVAMACAASDQFHTARSIKKFGITDSNLLYEIAKFCAEQPDGISIKYIDEFGLTDQNQLFKIAAIYSKKNGHLTARFIQKFRLKDPNHLYEIAKLCAKNCGNAEYIENFDLKDPIQLFEVAKLSAQTSGHCTAQYIRNFRIKEEINRVEIAKLCFKHNVYCLQYLLEFKIKEQAHLFEIAKICVQENAIETIKNIKKFGLTEENYIFEITKLSAKKGISNTVENMQDFGLTDEIHLSEVAKICAQQNGNHTARNIHLFGIKDPNLLFEIAMLCTRQQVGGNTAEFIQNFNITDPKQLYKLAKRCALQNGQATAQYFGSFGITEKNKIFRVAKLCVQQNGTSAFFFPYFGITDPSHLYKLAKLCAQKSGVATAAHIRKFGIENKDQLYTIAKLCVRQCGRAGEYIQNFNIKNQNQLFKIIKLCIEQYGDWISEHIHKFGFMDQNKLFEIAKLCASTENRFDDEVIGEYIGNFGITCQTQLFEIAKLCALHKQYTHTNIQNFGLISQNHLFEIAKLSAKYNSNATSRYILNFGIDDQNLLFEITKCCLLSASSDADRLQILFDLEQNKILNDFFKATAFLRSSEDISLEKINSILNPNALHGNPFGLVAEQILKISDLFIKEQNLNWLINSIILLNASKYFYRISDDQIQWLCSNEIYETIADFCKPSLRFSLSYAATTLVSTKNGTNTFNTIISSKSDVFKVKERWQKLTCLLSAILVSQGVNSDIFTAEGAFRAETEKPSSYFYKKENAQALIEMLILIVHETSLTAGDKEVLLTRIIAEVPKGEKENMSASREVLQTAYLQNIHSTISIFDFNEVEKFKDTSKSLVKISEDILASKFSCRDVPDFNTKYHEKFRENRNPFAIITYLSKIQSLADQKATDCLGDYVASTLNGTFKEDRYNLTNNLHLQKLNEFNAAMLEKWKTNLSIYLDELTFDEKSILIEKLSAMQWIKQKLITDKHLPNLNSLEFLSVFLNESDLPKMLKVEEALLLELKKALQKQKDVITNVELIKKMRANYEKISEIDSKLLSTHDYEQRNVKNYEEQKLREREKFIDALNHLLKQFPTLKQRFTKDTNSDEIIAILEGCGEIKEAAKESKEISAKLRMQLLCIQWIKGSEQIEILSKQLKKNKSQLIIADSTLDKSKKCLEEIQIILKAPPFNNPEFAHDIKGKINGESGAKVFSNEIVMETDDPIDLLLCGTEVCDSCQRVDGDSEMNKGLLGYLVDGKNKLLAIKSEEGPNGKIKARCLLRLLWDGEKPVLFMERFYPDTIAPKHVVALKALAQAKAKQLEIPLLSLHGSGENYGKTLMALGGPAPYEYSDGSGVGVTNGTFEIRNAKYLNLGLH